MIGAFVLQANVMGKVRLDALMFPILGVFIPTVIVLPDVNPALSIIAVSWGNG